jgi:tetratricopeptide (TPR) repeat protein
MRLNLDEVENPRSFVEAIKACREALRSYPRDKFPQQWATTQSNLGMALMRRAERANGEVSAKMLADAINAHREALRVYTREQFPQQWAMTHNNLGMALSLQGERAKGEVSERLLAEAATAFREALEVYTYEQFPQQWAVTQSNLGATLMRHGERSSGEVGTRILTKALMACREALRVRTREQSPQQWAMTQNNLAKVCYLLGDWRNAATSYANVLALYPRYEEGYQRLSSIYHEHLHEYSKAFDLHAKWLALFPDQVFVLADFAETHFTTGRFREFPQRLKAVLNAPELPSKTKIALQMIEIANLLALGKTDQIPGAVDSLLKAVQNEKSDFRITWSFNGTRRFINEHESLAPYRAWLNKLFAAAQEDNRDDILKKMRESLIQFRPANS